MMLDFYKGKNIFISGHTGFKGTWLSKILIMAGANVTGYALRPDTEPNLFELSYIDKNINSIIGDVRDFELLKNCFDSVKPDIVFHLAAQPLVSAGYDMPRYTFETNVMGTVNILESIRLFGGVKSFVNITTDKVYRNNVTARGFKEEDCLDGYDPYSNSKSCSELVTNSYRNSFFTDNTAISTVRAGNVIGGGDFAPGRIIPDCIRAAAAGENIEVFNPYAVRPYQHVLEALGVYLMIAEKQYSNIEYSGCYNVGPGECGCINNESLVQMFCDEWGGISWHEADNKNGFHEADILRLDCSKLQSVFNWRPSWCISTAVKKTVEWTKAFLNGENPDDIMEKQIKEFFLSD